MDEDGFGAKISMMDWETRTRVTRAKSGVRVGNQIYTTTKTIEVLLRLRERVLLVSISTVGSI